MPYITQDQRNALDPSINSVVDKMLGLSVDELQLAGVLNYVLTSTTLRLIQRAVPFRVGYGLRALFSGVLHNVAEEFYRRGFASYEDQKAHENGDLPEWSVLR